ncbi:SusD family protein [compost metagenome]
MAIEDERMRELCFEGVRKADLIRWGNFKADMVTFSNYAVSNGVTTGNNNGYQGIQGIEDRHTLLPKPIYELNLNKELIQNKGY